MKLRQSQIAALWVASGGNPAEADTASAIAMAESGGDTTIYNGTCCHGLYQINTGANNVSVAHANSPVWATVWSIHESKNGSDFSAWETYTNGDYKKFVGKSNTTKKQKHVRLPNQVHKEFVSLEIPTPIPGVSIPVPGTGGINVPDIPGPGKILESTGKGVEELTGFSGLRELGAFAVGAGELFLTPPGWLRLAKMLGGAYCVIWGLRILARESTGIDPVGAATNTAKKGAEAAAVVATVK